MKGVGKALMTLAILLGVAIGGYYAYRHQLAKEQGQSYSLAYAPGDLFREVVGIFSSRSSGSGGGTGSRTRPADEDPEPEAPGQDLYARGHDHYLAAEYTDAIPLFDKALGSPDAPPRVELEAVIARARLFEILLSDVEPGSDLEGPAVALLTPEEGPSLLVTLTGETDSEISFRASKGISSTVRKADLVALRIARTATAKRAIFEEEYRRKHAALESAGDWLDLARYASSHGLPEHVTYLMEKALDRPGDTVEAALYASWEVALATDRSVRAEAAGDLLQHFFRNGEYTRRVIAARARPAPQPVAVAPRKDPDSPKDPPNGIGSVGSRKRHSNPEVDALLEKADDLKTKGDDHYLKAFPGMPDVAVHRATALKAYEEARVLYEEVEEKWGVNLERTFRHLNERIYQLRKDTPVR
jgi:hypothetical protein